MGWTLSGSTHSTLRWLPVGVLAPNRMPDLHKGVSYVSSARRHRTAARRGGPRTQEPGSIRTPQKGGLRTAQGHALGRHMASGTRRGRAWRVLALAAGTAGAVVLVVAVSYARSMQPKLLALPSIVRTRLAQEHSVWVPFNHMPKMLVDATVATEDRSFWTNPGISFEGIARAAAVDLQHGAFLQGASTLQQQIVRDLFLSPKKTITRKLRGIVLAVTLTRDFPRPTLFALYVNEVYYGNGAYGLARAAQVYFGKSPRALTSAQSTLLAGLPQAPSYLDPLRHPKAAKSRQEIVVESLVEAGYISSSTARDILAAPWHLVMSAPA